MIDAYKEVAPNVTINYETTQNDYPTLLKAKLNSGEVPDIFSSTSGKEIDVYKEYSYDLAGQPLTETMSDAVAATMQSPRMAMDAMELRLREIILVSYIIRQYLKNVELLNSRLL